MSYHRQPIIWAGLCIIGFWLLTITTGCTYYFGNSWIKKAAGRDGDLHLKQSGRPAPLSRDEKIAIARPLLEYWANHTFNEEDYRESKVTFSRVFTARMFLQEQIPRTNELILQMEVVGNSGSTSFMNKKGDYDFREIGLVGMLYLFGDDPKVMYPQTTKHIVNTLLIETGSKPRTKTPRTMGIMKDTENHILMKEITRYLRNQWIFTHTSATDEFDNSKNGMDDWFYNHLNTMLETGAYEFNANPYSGYTFSALFTLHAFVANDSIKKLAEEFLDEENWQYALGSYQFKNYRPFRRRTARASRTGLYEDPHTSIMKLLQYKYENKPFTLDSIPGAYHQAIVALVNDYQLPDRVYELLMSDDAEYFVKIGHGRKASPEVLSAGDGYLLTAGGVKRGKVSQIAPRPISLILDDTASHITSCFFIPDERKPNKWNQTGVYQQFAVGRYPVHVPAQYKAVAVAGDWQVFQPYDDLRVLVATYSRKDLGIIVVYDQDDKTAFELLTELQQNNPDAKTLYTSINIVNYYNINYDLKSPKNRWVITSVDSQEVDRKFDKWPRHQGWIRQE